MKIGENRPVALITGASGGIGAKLASEIARDGYDLVLVSRDQVRLEGVSDDLQERFDICCQAMAMDLTAPGQVGILIEKLESQSIFPELIVNNAGFGLAGPAKTNDVTQQLGCIDLNIVVLSELTLKYLPSLVLNNRGGIINVGSVAGFFPGPNFATYYATKSFVHSFTYAIAHELKASNVKVCVICPGTTLTGFHKRAGMDRGKFAKSGVAMTAEYVARIGYAGYKKGQTVVVTGILNRFLVLMSHFLPTSWIASGVSRFNKT